MAKKNCQVASKPFTAEKEITTSDEELLEVTKMIEAEQEAKEKAMKENEALTKERAAMVAENTMTARPTPRNTGARPKLPNPVPSNQAMATKPTLLAVGNDSSDEELLAAVINLEHLQLTKAKSETHEGGEQHGAHQQGGHQAVHLQEEQAEGAWQVLDQPPSPGMMKSHPGRNQRWKEELPGQETQGQPTQPAS